MFLYQNNFSVHRIMRLSLKNTDHKQIIFKLSCSLFQDQRMNLSFVERISIGLPNVFDSKLSFFSVFKVLARLEFINIK